MYLKIIGTFPTISPIILYGSFIYRAFDLAEILCAEVLWVKEIFELNDSQES